MRKIAIAVHGGAGTTDAFFDRTVRESELGLKQAIETGYQILNRGGSALDAVEAAVTVLEDDPYFNAGKGSALNCEGEVEMDASIMDGKSLAVGAVSMLTRVKNPIQLAKIMTNHNKPVFLSGYGALKLAKEKKLALKSKNYFLTEHKIEEYERLKKIPNGKKIRHGTVGAVALDKFGNIAAGTSTGGMSSSLPGRIGDSCVIGAGCYADNQSCAISCTGEGEFIIRGVTAHTIAMLVKLQKITLKNACEKAVFKCDKKIRGEVGVIAINKLGEIVITYNTESMRRAWIDVEGNMRIEVY